MKKLSAILCLLLAVLLLPSGTSVSMKAAQNMSVFQAFSHDGILYAYIDAPGADRELISISARIGDSTYPRTGPVATAEELSVPSYCIILVDTSGSVLPFRDQIEEFVNTFLDESPDGTQFLLAPFGDESTPEGDFTDNRDEIKNELAGLTYQAGQTSLYAGICEAVDYFGERTSGELHQIIVITDGLEADKNGVTAEEVKEKLRGSTAAVHTLGLFKQKGTGTAAAKESLKVLGSFARVSMGLHQVLGYDDRSAAELAVEIPAYISRLYAAKFDLTGFQSAGREYNVVFTLREGNSSLGELECMVKVPLAALTFPSENDRQDPYAPIPLTEPNPSELPTESGTPEPSAELPSDPNTPEPSAEPDQAEPSSDPNAPFPSEGSPPETKADSSPPGSGRRVPLCLPYLLGAAVGMSAAAGILLLIRKKRPKKGTPAAGGGILPPEKSGIFMRLEVLSGNYRGNNFEFYLKNELIIGRNKSCDISFKDKDVSGKNSRVFLHNNAIYLEDLRSQNGTAISDMRIHTQNRLRSGDIISIGSVCFTLKF